MGINKLFIEIIVRAPLRKQSPLFGSRGKRHKFPRPIAGQPPGAPLGPHARNGGKRSFQRP